MRAHNMLRAARHIIAARYVIRPHTPLEMRREGAMCSPHTVFDYFTAVLVSY